MAAVMTFCSSAISGMERFPSAFARKVYEQRRIFIFGALGYFKLGPFWKVYND